VTTPALAEALRGMVEDAAETDEDHGITPEETAATTRSCPLLDPCGGVSKYLLTMAARKQSRAAGPPASRSVTEGRDPAATRERILAAAEGEFAAHGLRGARVQEIVTRAGVNERMLYHYFGDKDGLYMAVLRRFITHVAADIEKVVEAPAEDPVERLADILRRYFDALAKHPEIVRVYLHEVLAGSPSDAKVQEIRREIEDRISPRFSRFFTDAERSGVFRGGLDWRLVIMLAASFGLLFPMALPRLEQVFAADFSDPAQLAAIREAMIDTLLQGVLVRPRPRRKAAR
jgi:TetR/AcrR family transcriptional regulator